MSVEDTSSVLGQFFMRAAEQVQVRWNLSVDKLSKKGHHIARPKKQTSGKLVILGLRLGFLNSRMHGCLTAWLPSLICGEGKTSEPANA